MSVGDHVITMTYSGDTNFTVATSPSTPTWDQHVVADNTTITLTHPLPANSNTFPPNNLVYSVYTPVTLQATLSSLTGTTPFTANGDGGVTFYMNGVAINADQLPEHPLRRCPNCTNMAVTGHPDGHHHLCRASPCSRGTTPSPSPTSTPRARPATTRLWVPPHTPGRSSSSPPTPR